MIAPQFEFHGTLWNPATWFPTASHPIQNVANIGDSKRQFVVLKSRPLYDTVIPLSPSHAHPSEDNTVLSQLFQHTILAGGMSVPLLRLEITRVFSKKLDRHNDCTAIRILRHTVEPGIMTCNCKAPYPKYRQHRLLQTLICCSQKSTTLWHSYTIVPQSCTSLTRQHRFVTTPPKHNSCRWHVNSTADARSYQGVF